MKTIIIVDDLAFKRKAGHLGTGCAECAFDEGNLKLNAEQRERGCRADTNNPEGNCGASAYWVPVELVVA